MNNLWFLFAAYMIIWLGIWGYTMRLGGKLKQLSVELAHVRTLLLEWESKEEEGDLR